jgi:hypothetical protein
MKALSTFRRCKIINDLLNSCSLSTYQRKTLNSKIFIASQIRKYSHYDVTLDEIDEACAKKVFISFPFLKSHEMLKLSVQFRFVDLLNTRVL